MRQALLELLIVTHVHGNAIHTTMLYPGDIQRRFHGNRAMLLLRYGAINKKQDRVGGFYWGNRAVVEAAEADSESSSVFVG
jgi:hypothetical protein